MIKMTPEESIKMCCAIKCMNTSSNSKVKFFTFPMDQCRSYQRNKWVQAIKNENGRCWMPTAHSLVCSDHFVNGKPSTNFQDTDYAPSIFGKTRKAETIKSRAVSVKTFGLEYIKHTALLEKPSRANASNDQRKCAYVKLAAAVGIPVTMVRAWERRFRDYVQEKMAEPPDNRKLSADGKPHWLTKVVRRLYTNAVQRQVARAGAGPARAGAGPARGVPAARGVLAALCAAARARGSLCSTALYNDVRRVLRMSTAINDLHAVWVSAQRVSLQQVVVSSRAGDAAHAAPPPGAAAVADLVLLHTDVDILTDESVTLYEESAALHTLWQLIQRHRLEDAAPAHSRVRAQRWTRAHRTYLDSGRTVSLVVLQRRWYELKLQARVRLAMHWRRPGPFDDLTPGPGPASTPNELYPRPAPLHIAILKRYPHIATGHFKSWRQQVLEGTLVTEPLEEEDDINEIQSNNEQSTDTTNTADLTTGKQLYPNITKVEQPTVDEPMIEQPPDNDPLNEGTTDTYLLKEENDVKETKSNVNKQSTETIDTGDDAVVKQLYPNITKVEQPTVDETLNEGNTDTDLQEEENDVKETKSNVKKQSTDITNTADNATGKQLYHNIIKVEQPTVDEPMIEHLPDNDPLNEGPTDTDLQEEEKDVKETKSNVKEQSTETTDTADDAAVKQLYPNMSKVEQPAVDEPKNEQTFYEVPLVEQRYFVKCKTADAQSAEHTTDNVPLADEPTVHEPKVEQSIDSGSLTDNHVDEQTKASDCLVAQRAVGDHLPKQTTDDLLAVQSTMNLKHEPKIEQTTDLLINQSYTHAEIPVVHAGNTATAHIPDMLGTPDTQGGPDISSEKIHRAEDKSNEVIPPKRAYSSDTDTDTEDNLVIDECSNKTPFSLKREPHTETHSFDTVSPHAALGNMAPTIEVLHMIDPNTVKTEILFESDEDDFQPCDEVDKNAIELDVKKEGSFISNRIMFVDEEPGVSRDVTSVDDDMGRMDWEDGQEIDDPVNDTPTIDSKLLMDTQVRVVRIDEIPPWIKNVRKDNSIRVSRIHRRYYTPKLKHNCSNTRTRTQNTRLDLELQTSSSLNTTTTAKTQEIRVDKSCLDKVANTHSIRQLCSNIKRELIDDQLEMLEGKASNKRAKTESDSDNDKPLLVLRERQPSRETTEDTVVREMVEESSSDDEFLIDEMFGTLRGEERKRARGASRAASTIEWSAAFAPALGRVAKRVSLPDIEQVRRYNSSMQVAQVAPITTTVGPCDDGAMQAGQHPGDGTAADDMPEAWRALDLPADDELQAALDDLTTAPAPEAVQERSHCCAARRHREVNDTRRRIGLADIPLHNHPDGVCACCCAHLSDVDVRLRLDQQLRALHEDIEKMLRKCAGGKIQSKPTLKPSRSPSPARASTSATTATAATCAHKKATKAAPSNAATVAKGSKAKPATYTNRSRKRRSRARAPPDPAPSPPAVSDYEEWQRQKNMNAKYFHINGNISSKKGKITTAQVTAEQITTAQGTAVQSATAQGTAVQSATTQGTAVQSATTQGTAVQSATTQGTAVQSATTQGTAVQSASAQGTIVQSATAQSTAVQSTTAQASAAQSTTAQTVTKKNTITQTVAQPGLMPYIRQSRLVSPPEEPRARRANPVQPLSRNRLVNIAPKPTDMRRASELVQHSVVVGEPATMPEGIKSFTIPITNSYQSLAAAPRRMNLTTEVTAAAPRRINLPTEQVSAAGPRPMNLTTEQVSEPNSQPVQVMRVNSVPMDKPVSILEEYSRTLSTETVNNTPVVNALSLRVPSGPQGPKTTILMALTLPSEDMIKQTINRLYANDTVDLTKEPETSTSAITKTNTKQKKTNPIDLVRAFRNLVNPGNENKGGRSLLKTLTTTKSGKSLLKTTITNTLHKLPDTGTRDTAPMLMSLSKKLHDGDVIEIDDTDSSSHSDDNPSIITKSSNPAVYSNKGPNQAKSSRTKQSSKQSTSEADKSSNQAAGNSNEAVSETNEGSNQASTTKSSNQTTGDINKSAQKLKRIINRSFKEKYNNRCAKAAVFKKSNVSVEAVVWHSDTRPCSSIPVLASLTDGSARCPARFANVAAMTAFMAALRRAAAQPDKEVYCHKWSAVQQPVSALPCGGTLLCVDGARAPLVLPAAGRRERATPHARAHLVLTDADPPCALPTYWTLASFGKMARVLPDELVSTSAPDVSDAPVANDAEPRVGGARWSDARGEWVTPKEDRKICEKNHNFKILTAFCSADGIRQAARAGASLLLLSVLRARVVVLTLQRDLRHGVVRHLASADVEEELLRELEGLLDQAEIDEQWGARADIIGQ